MNLSHSLFSMTRAAHEGAALLRRVIGALSVDGPPFVAPALGGLECEARVHSLGLALVPEASVANASDASPAAGLPVRGKWRRLVGPVKTQPGDLRVRRRQVAGSPGPTGAEAWIIPLGCPRQGAL